MDVDHVNNLGWTALLEAVILLSDGGPRHQAIVRMLLDAGADPELADTRRRDAAGPRAAPAARPRWRRSCVEARRGHAERGGRLADQLEVREGGQHRLAADLRVAEPIVTSSSLRVSFELITIPSPQRAWRTRSPSR